METIYLCIIIFLFVLAVFDLIVGVSNDAVNFLNSAVGAKAASFKTILFIAGIGIFIGASLSNGMMDIARHGIYQPEHFYFAEIMCILLAVMLTVLSLDTTAQRMAAYGGEISLCYLLERFLPRLEAAGFPPGTLADFTVLNCRRLFAG